MSRTQIRRRRILDLISAGEEDVDALAAMLDVSASTIRRDLATMSDAGVVTRTYGGAVLAHAAPEQSLCTRERINAAAKEAIGRAAAALVEDGDTLLLDAGSTIAAFGRALIDRRVRIVTSNLPLVPLLVQRGLEVVVLGGEVRPISMGVVGPYAELVLRRLTVDKAFLGADGVVAGRGLCEARPEQCALKELMMAQAREVFVLADAAKLANAGQQYWARLPAHWTLVTDGGPDRIEPFGRLPSVRIVRA
jgi:DeoR/GlpR family transcriptional regulator of sugar metabolism